VWAGVVWLRLRAGGRKVLLKMSLIRIYQCLCDETRLRILHLLTSGELCVCHIQEILNEPQVKVSKHLAYLRKHGLVEARKEANWMIYSLPTKPSHELAANLACLQDCAAENALFRRDSAKRGRLARKFSESSPICCSAQSPGSRTATHS
jgi:ArsR family transcriptional regulator, arsenate/arsenite/antimonite-responsive transcriptional repressor